MHKKIKILALLIFTGLYAFSQQTGMPEVEDNEGKLEAIKAERMEMLKRTAGTSNFSLRNLQEFQKFNAQNYLPGATAGLVNGNGGWSQLSMTTSSWGMGRVNCFAIQPGNNNIMYVGTPTGGLWKTISQGGVWTNYTMATPVPGVSGICIDPNDVNTIYILTGSASSGDESQSIGVLKSTNGGVDWFPTGLDSTRQAGPIAAAWNGHKLLMDPLNSNILYACMTNGLFRTMDGGDSWTKIFPSGNGTANVTDMQFHPVNSNDIYITIGGGFVFTSRDRGNQFSAAFSLPNPPGNSYQSTTIAVSQAAPDSIFFLATVRNPADEDSVYILRGKYDLSNNSISFNPVPRKCLISGSYVTSALRWYRDARLAVSPLSTAKMYIGGLHTYASSDYGNSWILKSTDNPPNSVNYNHTDCSTLRYETDGYVYSCNDGGIFRQTASETNASAGWQNLNGALYISQIFKLGGSQVSTDNFNVALQDNGCHFRTFTNYKFLMRGDGAVARMDPNNANLFYGAYIGGASLTRYRNAVETSLDPTGIFEPAGSGYGYLPFEVSQLNGRRLYTAFKALYISNDTGNTWIHQVIPGAIKETRYMAVTKADSNTVIVIEDSTFKMRRTDDGGNSFFSLTKIPGLDSSLISGVVISPFNKNRIYVTADGYLVNKKVYLSTDGGFNWQNISVGLPNVPVHCLAYESSSNNSIYIGTEIGVYYYNDVLQKWISFNNGMPLCRVTDFYINYTAGKITAATYGRGLFTSDLFGTCDPLVVLNTIVNGFLTYSAGTQLNSTQTIYGGISTNAKYYAGNAIFLQPGFQATRGIAFVAGISSCGGKIDPVQNLQQTDSTTGKPAAGKAKQNSDLPLPVKESQQTTDGQPMLKRDEIPGKNTIDEEGKASATRPTMADANEKKRKNKK